MNTIRKCPKLLKAMPAIVQVLLCFVAIGASFSNGAETDEQSLAIVPAKDEHVNFKDVRSDNPLLREVLYRPVGWHFLKDADNKQQKQPIESVESKEFDEPVEKIFEHSHGGFDEFIDALDNKAKSIESSTQTNQDVNVEPKVSSLLDSIAPATRDFVPVLLVPIDKLVSIFPRVFKASSKEELDRKPVIVIQDPRMHWGGSSRIARNRPETLVPEHDKHPNPRSSVSIEEIDATTTSYDEEADTLHHDKSIFGDDETRIEEPLFEKEWLESPNTTEMSPNRKDFQPDTLDRDSQQPNKPQPPRPSLEFDPLDLEHGSKPTSKPLKSNDWSAPLPVEISQLDPTPNSDHHNQKPQAMESIDDLLSIAEAEHIPELTTPTNKQETSDASLPERSSDNISYDVEEPYDTGAAAESLLNPVPHIDSHKMGNSGLPETKNNPSPSTTNHDPYDSGAAAEALLNPIPIIPKTPSEATYPSPNLRPTKINDHNSDENNKATNPTMDDMHDSGPTAESPLSAKINDTELGSPPDEMITHPPDTSDNFHNPARSAPEASLHQSPHTNHPNSKQHQEPAVLDDVISDPETKLHTSSEPKQPSMNASANISPQISTPSSELGHDKLAVDESDMVHSPDTNLQAPSRNLDQTSPREPEQTVTSAVPTEATARTQPTIQDEEDDDDLPSFDEDDDEENSWPNVSPKESKKASKGGKENLRRQ